jgi:hypothetical protein
MNRSSALTKPPTLSIVPQPAPTFVDLATPVTELIAELRPDLPMSICASLAVEAMDQVADSVLDEAWARQRQRLYPAALRAAHRRHTGRYAASVPRTLEDIGATYMGRPTLQLVT